MPDSLMIRCTRCGATNRVPVEKLEQRRQPVCGRCKAALPAADKKPVAVTDATFSAEVERSPLPVLLDLWGPWCARCRTVARVLDGLASEMAGHGRVAKVNLDDNPATASRVQVRSIPTRLVLKRGEELERNVGVQPKQEILRRLE